jgi:hypothetical protein
VQQVFLAHRVALPTSSIVFFGGLIETSHPMGINPKKLILGSSVGISSLNVYGRISAKQKHIIMLDGSKCTFRQDTMCNLKKLRGGVISGVKFTTVFFLR